MGHPPVRPRGAGRQRGQAAGRRRERRPVRRRGRACRCSARGPGSPSAAASTRGTATSTRTGWPPRRSTRRCATSSPSAPTRRASRSSTTSAGATSNDPDVLGALVRAAEACRDVAVAFGTPFISGKDSLNNTYAGKDGERLDIPHTLLVSAIGRVPDVRKCVTMDLKEAGQRPVPRRRRRGTNSAARTITSSPGEPAASVPGSIWNEPRRCSRRFTRRSRKDWCGRATT